MRKSFINRSILALLATVSMLTVASCTSSEEPGEIFQAAPFYNYEAMEISIEEEGYDVSPRSVAFGKDSYVVLGIGYNDTILAAENRWYDSFGSSDFQVLPTDEEGNISVVLKELYFYSEDGAIISTVNLDEVQGYSREIPCISIDSEDHVHAIVCNGELETGNLYYYDLSFDTTGELLAIDNLKFDQHVDVYSAYYLDDGSVCIYCADNVTYSGFLYTFSSSGELLTKTEYPVLVKSFVSVNNTDYVFCSRYDNETDESTACLLPIDSIADSNMENAIILPEQFIDANNIVGTNNGLLIWNTPYLYCYNIETEETSTVIDFTECDCPYMPYYYSTKPDGTIVYFGYDGLYPEPYLVQAIPSDTDPLEGREKLIVAGVGINNDPIILNMVKTFNMNSNDYYFEVVDYGGDAVYESEGYMDNLDQYYNDFLDDIRYSHISENSPDVIVDAYNMLPFSEISSGDYLVDLSVYSDEGPDEELLPWYDGLYENGQYSAFLAYQIDLLAIDNSNQSVNDLETVDYSRFDSESSQLGFDGISLIGRNKTEYLSDMVQLRIDDFYNIQTQEVHFDSQEFADLLEWVKYSVNDNENNDYSLGNGAFGRTVSLQTADQICYDVDQISSNNVSYIGYPSDGDNLVAAIPRYSFAVTSDSSHPDVAWDLISLGYSEKYQTVFSRIYFPVNQDVESENRDIRLNQIDDDILRNIYLTRINSIIDSVNCLYSVNNDLREIITEEASTYFYGDISLEVAVDRIQNRASLVMMENYT